MNAEIIAVGSELLTPRRLDTNSLYLTEKLNELGIEVVAKAVIGLTGGLGPTEDDVTRDAVAHALGKPLVYREELWEAIQNRFRAMGRKLAEINRRQAYLIRGPAAARAAPGTPADV